MNGPIDPINELRQADPGRSLPPMDEPWRTREKILMATMDTGGEASRPNGARRERLVQVLGALGIGAAVWGLVAVSGGSGLPTIALAGGGRVATEGAPVAGVNADNKLGIFMPMQYEFVLEDGVDIAAGRGKVYRWVGPTESEVRSLADKLGVTGAIEPLPTEQGAGWQFGDPASQVEGSKYFVVYSTGSFSYYPSATAVRGSTMCVVPGSSGSGGGTDAKDATNAPDASCEVNPEPTKNLPTKNDAEATLREFFGDLTDVNVYADQYSVYASGAVSSGVSGIGDAGKQWVSLTFGENASIVGAYGMLGRLEEVGAYPTISARDAVARLSQGILIGASTGNPMAGDAVRTAPAANASGSASGTGEVVTSDTILVDPIPVPSGSTPQPPITIESIPSTPTEPVPSMPTVTVIGAPTTTVPVQKVTVHLVKVSVVYQQLWDAKGVMWVVPAYQYTDSDGGQWVAYSVDDKYLSIPQVEPPVAVMEGGVAVK